MTSTNQHHSSILSQAPTVPSQPLQPLTMTSPAIPLPQQTMLSSPKEVVYTPPLSNESRQPSSNLAISSKPEPAHQGISRRAIVLGLGVAGLTVAGGGLTWLVSSQGKHPSVVSGQTPTSIPRQTLTVTSQASPSPTPPPIPLGTLLYTYRGHSNWVRSVAWSPDGKRIASGSDDKTVQVWKAG
jgi:WD40 repeat protein